MIKNLELQTQWIFRDKYNGKWNKEILNDIIRLKSGEPVDYIIGWKPFLNCKIDLSFKPLIPRPETEYWVEKFIKEISPRKLLSLKIADVFSGSGCIGIAVLKNIKNSKVDFFEIDSNLIKQIKLNLKINKISKSRYHVINANILKSSQSPFRKEALPSFEKRVRVIIKHYDFILANPPYIALSRKNKVQKSVLKYEPKKAFFAGKDGLNIIKKFLNEAQRQLDTKGEIWVEFDSFQKSIIDKILKQQKYKNWEFFKDQYKKWRWVKIA